MFFAGFWGHKVTSLLTNELCLFNSQGRRVFARTLRRQKWRSGGVAEWLKAADCKSARVAYGGSNPTPTTIVGVRGRHLGRYAVIVV